MTCDGWRDAEARTSWLSFQLLFEGWTRGAMGVAGTAALHSLVDVVLDRQQVVAHRLEGQLVQHRGSRVKAAVQDEELGASFVRTLQSRGKPSAAGLGAPPAPQVVRGSRGHFGVPARGLRLLHGRARPGLQK